MQTNHDLERRADWVIDVCKQLYPVKGLIVSPEIDEAFDKIKRLVPQLKINSYPTGLEIEDWIVPKSWRGVAGRLESETGEVLASSESSFLFIAPYSEPVNDWFSKLEIGKRIRTRPEHPDAYVLEHRNAYDFSLVDWGITLPYNVWSRMTDTDRYKVIIETDVQDGHLRVGEWVLPGKRPEIICICSQFDELCNDGQSSAVLALDLMVEISKRPEREFTYQLLMVPEMFGSIFYILDNPEKVSRTIGMYNLETLGAGKEWLLKRSLKGDGFLDRALELAFKDNGINFTSGTFFDGYGNDERVFSWPTVGVPGTGLQRYPYSHYHTNYDTPDDLQRELLMEAIAISESLINIVESDYIPVFRGRVQPWLTKHGLYFDHYVTPEDFSKMNNHVLFNVNGQKPVSELAASSGVAFHVLHAYLERFVAAGLIVKDRR